MNKKLFTGVMAVLLLLFQAMAVYAADDWTDYLAAIRRGDFRRAEWIVRENVRNWDDYDKNRVMATVLAITRGDVTVRELRVLATYGIRVTQTMLYCAFDQSQPDSVIQYILGQGVEPTADILRAAISAKRFNYVSQFINRVGDLDYRENRTKQFYVNHPEYWKPEYSKTALILAVEADSFSTVQQLVERGANVNLRAEDGSTAASIAYDRGNMQIYNYLKEYGTIDFEPKAAAPASPPSSTTNTDVEMGTQL
jgi:hypothetical protein